MSLPGPSPPTHDRHPPAWKPLKLVFNFQLARLGMSSHGIVEPPDQDLVEFLRTITIVEPTADRFPL
jgi:hypothetical protein